MESVIQTTYFLTAVLFIVGLKRMSSPLSALSGVRFAGLAMLLAVVVTFFWPGLENLALIAIAVAAGSLVAWISAQKVSMTNMPQMIAIYNGMGGGAAACISAIELSNGSVTEAGLLILAIVGGLIGAISFSGSLVAFGKLQGLLRDRPLVFPLQKIINLLVLLLAFVLGGCVFTETSPEKVLFFFLASLAFGVMMTIPIGGGDMPVVISLYNALTGLAVGFEGFALGNAAMIVAGTVVGAAGTLLTVLMSQAMNRSLANVLFGAFGQEAQNGAGREIKGSMKEMGIDDAAILLAYAERVIVVPGYGMAVAQAQHKIRELAELLKSRGATVKFAIHPVAGRMPGHMNVLLAEANIPYEELFDIEEINPEFGQTDVSLVIGANDVVNPAARSDKSSPIYGMPILDVDKSKNALIIKRGKGKGFAGIENELFYAENARMVYGDAQDVVGKLVQALKKL